MPQKLTMTEAGTGKAITHTVSNMSPPLLQIATIEDFGIYRSRHNGPITAEGKNEWFNPLSNHYISVIQLQHPKKMILVLNPPEEIEKAIAGKVTSLHMNDTLLAAYKDVLRHVERVTKTPYLVARFGLAEAVSPDNPDFRTLPRTVPQICNALAAGKPLGLINPVSNLRTFTRPKAASHYGRVLKHGA